MPNYKLIYFNGRGRAETIRLCFAAAGIKYEDKRVEKADWPALKPTTPWGSMPLLEVDGKVVGQSLAIARLVAREGGLMGKNAVETGQIDAVTDVVTDLREKAFAMHFTPDGPAKDAAVKDFAEKTLPSILPNLEKVAAGNPEKSGFFVGGKLSLADLHFYAVLEAIKPSMPNILAQHANLSKLYDKVGASPKVAEYIKKRPQTPF
jgi:glutathione S-transferase